MNTRNAIYHDLTSKNVGSTAVAAAGRDSSQLAIRDAVAGTSLNATSSQLPSESMRFPQADTSRPLLRVSSIDSVVSFDFMTSGCPCQLIMLIGISASNSRSTSPSSMSTMPHSLLVRMDSHGNGKYFSTFEPKPTCGLSAVSNSTRTRVPVVPNDGK